MFFRAKLFHTILLPAQDLQMTYRQRLSELLRLAVEGQQLPGIGLVLGVLEISLTADPDGKLLDSGEVSFVINYEALIFKLFKNEIVDGIVVGLTSNGVKARVGPEYLFIQLECLGYRMNYNESSSNLMMGAINSHGEAFVKDDHRIAVNSKIRIRVIRPDGDNPTGTLYVSPSYGSSYQDYNSEFNDNDYSPDYGEYAFGHNPDESAFSHNYDGDQ